MLTGSDFPRTKRARRRLRGRKAPAAGRGGGCESAISPVRRPRDSNSSLPGSTRCSRNVLKQAERYRFRSVRTLRRASGRACTLEANTETVPDAVWWAKTDRWLPSHQARKPARNRRSSSLSHLEHTACPRSVLRPGTFWDGQSDIDSLCRPHFPAKSHRATRCAH